MKILFDDGMQIPVGTGIGKYSLFLYKSLKNKCDITNLNYQSSIKNKILQRIRYIFYINSTKFQKNIKEYDYVFFTNYAIPFIKNKKAKYAVTIHDMVAYKYPETLSKFYRIYNRLMISNSMKKADIIFTISDSVRNEIQELYPQYIQKVNSIWIGAFNYIELMDCVGEYESETLYGLDNNPFFLFVSTIEKRKNVGFVIDAFLNLKANCENAKDYKLVLAGRPGLGYQDFLDKVLESKFKNDIIFTGYISDNDCNHLYNKAKAFVFPTIYEGFGLAQIECMRCHLPIILSNIPTNIEISRDYGLFFDLNNIDTLITQMKVIVDNKYDYTSKNALADIYLEDFNWDKIADKYLEAFKKFKN